jgi:UDP-2,4-diacetamido-2,4,6-trideoxy-beta-L-altropyranose hydrolase
VVAEIDLAIVAAGLTSYELACAGVPQLAIAVVPNQRRVIDGLRRHYLAICLDLTDGERLGDLPAALRRMRDPALRHGLSERGMQIFDGRGAERVASAVSEILLQSPANEH